MTRPPPDTSYFSLPLPLWQQPLSFRTAKYERLKRRGKHRWLDKKEYEDSDEFDDSLTSDENENENEDEDRRSEVSRGTRKSNGNISDGALSRSKPNTPRSSVLLTPDEAHQYRISGLSMDSELPGGNFPHGPGPSDISRGKDEDEDENEDEDGETSKKKKGKKSTGKHETVEAELAELNPPLYIPGGNPAQKNRLRMHHLGVITTILHRCLMEGDYIRAGRAWGLILRDEFGGHPIDVRNEGRWGIGAEILLWTEQDPATTMANNDGDGGLKRRRRGRKFFSRFGFERAKAYYERLILQYPYRKSAPNALGPLNFYPAMFGLWVSIVQEESRVKRDAAVEELEGVGNDDASFGHGDGDGFQDRMSISSDMGINDTRRGDQLLDQRTKAIIDARILELEEAHQIASQMDDLLVSPPYSDSSGLLKFRGMVSLWIADLLVSSVAPDHDEDDDYDDDMANVDGYGEDNEMLDHDGDLNVTSYDYRLEKRQARIDLGLAKEKKRAELEKAETFFGKSKVRQSRAKSSVG